MNPKVKFTIERLPHAEQSGDWHDKPLKWVANSGEQVFTQKFHTRKNAELWRKMVRRHGDFNAASRAYIEA